MPAIQSFDNAFDDNERELTTARATDTLRNVSYVAAGVRTQIQKTVGDYYRMSYEPDLAMVGLTARQGAKFIDSVERQFEVDARSDDHWFDASGRMTFTQICACSMFAHYAQGESILIAEYLDTQKAKGHRPFASAVSVINPDRVMTPPDMLDDKLLRSGFKKTVKGYAYGMYVLNRHPTDWMATAYEEDVYKYIRRHTPWGRERWRHVNVTEAPDQTRGRTQLATSIMDSRMLDRFNKAVLSNAITQGLYAAVVESADPVTAFQGLQAIDPNASVQAQQRHMAQRQGYYEGGGKALTMNNAKIAHMMPGDTLKFLTPNSSLDQVDPFSAIFFRNVARSLDISYEELTGDYTKTNYSGARAGDNNSDMARRTLSSQVPSPVARFMFRLWLEEQINMGRVYVPTGRTSRQRLNWFLNNKGALTVASFYGPGTKHIDPVKGTTGAMNEMRMGTLTRKDYCLAYTDKTIKQQLQQQALERAMAEDLGIDLDAGLGIVTQQAEAETPEPEDTADTGNDTDE